MLRSPANIGPICCCVPFFVDPDLELHTVLCFGPPFWLLIGKFELQKNSESNGQSPRSFLLWASCPRIDPTPLFKVFIGSTLPWCTLRVPWEHRCWGQSSVALESLAKEWVGDRATTQVVSFSSISMYAGFVTPWHSSFSSSPAMQLGAPDSADILALTIPKLCCSDALVSLQPVLGGNALYTVSTSWSPLYTQSSTHAVFGGYTVNPFESKYRSKKTKNLCFLTILKMGDPLNLYLILLQEEWCWHRVRACAIQYQSGNEKWEWTLHSGKHQKLTLLHVLNQEPRACDKLICSLSSKVKKSLHPLRSFQHSRPHHEAGYKGFLTSLGENESSHCIFVSVHSGAAGLGIEVYVLPWQHVKSLQGEQTLHFAGDLGEMGADCRCCLSSEISWVPPCSGVWMGTASVCLVFA